MRLSVIAMLVSCLASSAAAQDAPPPSEPASEEGGTDLGTYLQALSERRLIAAETGSVERMRRLVRRGEDLFLNERYEEASRVLFEVAESPRFADYAELPEFRGAEFMLARALERLGALRSSQRYLLRILERGTEDLYFGPAYRKFVDVTLESGDLRGGIAKLEALEVGELGEDSQNELQYLKGRERYDLEAFDEAEPLLAEVTRVSRFFASAQYLRGVIAVRRDDLQEAEELFCSIAGTGHEDRYSFFVDDRFFEVQDLARLGLGRVAHEGLRSDDAFYYYFQVPNDSERVAEALFESAYAMYEGGDYETAVDLLDQLEARFPETSFADEAKLLRGYVHLGRCEFQEASELFVRFQQVFEPIRREVEIILANPARQERLFDELLREEERLSGGPREVPEGETAQTTVRGLVLAMTRVDPTFYRLHADVRILDAEAARAGRLTNDLSALAERVTGGERPRAAAEADDGWDEAGELRQDIEGARAIMTALTQQIDAMRGQAPNEQLREIEVAVRELGQRLRTVEHDLDTATSAGGDAAAPEGPATNDVDELLRRDIAHARTLPSRVSSVRAQLVTAANEAALRALRNLQRRLGTGLRRARIGRIDAIMGSKRRIEIQIESLAAGRFPPELQDPLRIQGLLRDDEEYWPFEGELWTDEFDETDPVEEILEQQAEEAADRADEAEDRTEERAGGERAEEDDE
jgi:tetratricopeptide (TPR) repeat protein